MSKPWAILIIGNPKHALNITIYSMFWSCTFWGPGPWKEHCTNIGPNVPFEVPIYGNSGTVLFRVLDLQGKLKFPANTGFDGLNLCGESSPHQKWQWSSGPPNELAHLAMCSCVAESFSVSSAQNLEKSWHCGIHVRYGSFIEILIMSRLRPNTYNSITSWCSPAKHSPYWLGQCKDNVSKRPAVRMSELPKNVWTNKSGGKSRNVVCCGTLTWSDFMGIG